MNLSAVVCIMLNKDKDIYLQESIEDGQYIMLSQPPEIQVKCLFHGQICDLGNFKSHPVVIFRRTFPSILTSLISRSPWGVHHFKNKICSIGHSEPWHNLLAEPIPLHIWPHLRHTRWRLLAALHLSLCQKLLSLECVTFQEQSAWPLLIRLEPGHSSWSAYFS